MEDSSLLDLETARLYEAKRREKMLGSLAGQVVSDATLRIHARRTSIPIRHLRQWHKLYGPQKNLEALKPDWHELSESLLVKALERLHLLGPLADAEIITEEETQNLARPPMASTLANSTSPGSVQDEGLDHESEDEEGESEDSDSMIGTVDRPKSPTPLKLKHGSPGPRQEGWSLATAKRWLSRYRIYGLWGLAYVNDPKKPQHISNTRPDIGSLTPEGWEEVNLRLRIIAPFIGKPKATRTDVETQAQKVGVAPRTVWNYLRAHREYGVQGLVPIQRADKGQRHSITERMTDLIESLRVIRPGATIEKIQSIAIAKAEEWNEPEPTIWQVRNICRSVDEPTLLLAKGRVNDFRNNFRFTHLVKIDGVIYEADSTPVDVMVKDLRRAPYCTRDGQVRPVLTVIVERNAPIVVAARFSYDRPDAHIIAATVREALLGNGRSGLGGIPLELRIDNGKEFKANLIRGIARAMGFRLHICKPGNPQEKPHVERFFGTLNTRLWADQPGYVASNTKERPQNVKAELTLAELTDRFWTFIEQYHNEIREGTEQTRRDYWREQCFVEPVEDEDLLDALLLNREIRKVIKGRVSIGGHYYWHQDLAVFSGQEVIVRYPPRHEEFDEVVIYNKQDETRICKAIREGSTEYWEVTAEQVRAAQANQTRSIRDRIKQARAIVAEAGIDDQRGQLTALPSQAKMTNSVTPSNSNPDETSSSANTTELNIKSNEILESGSEIRQEGEALTKVQAVPTKANRNASQKPKPVNRFFRKANEHLEKAEED